MPYLIAPSVLLCAVRIGVIYILSALTGSSVATLFLQDRPLVASSGALFGLLGAMVSGLIWNWKIYTRKVLVTSTSILSMLLVVLLELIITCILYLSLQLLWSSSSS